MAANESEDERSSVSSDNRESLRAEIEELKAALNRNSGDNQAMMLSLIQSISRNSEAIADVVSTRRKGKVYVDKPEKFEGATGDEIKSWIRRWETYYGQRERQDGVIDDRTKIESALQTTSQAVGNALMRQEDEYGEWATWDEFKGFMLSKYSSSASGIKRFEELIRMSQRTRETVNRYYD
jgi:hypothetical protein